ncbi:MAG: tetratricopeptide repeat protein [Bacteroidaceae bacterium]|nr:tetratricopeptide repeat protein [Bacteroidaceae bacterium]
MMKIGMLLAVVCSLLAACGTDPVEQWLTRAEACMEVNADSALRCLQYIEATGACSDEQRARYALLRTQAMHKCRIPLESDSLINVAVAYYTNSDDHHRLALSLLYKGLVHKQNHQVEQATEAFVGSEQAFEGVEDNQYKALLCNHYGALLMNQGVYEEALDYSLKSYQYKLLGDSIHYIVSSCSQIAKLYKVLNMSDSAKAYYERGLSYVNGLSRKQYYYALLQNYASFLMQNGELEKAERLFKECEINAPFEISDNVYSALATFYQIVGRYEDALQYCRRTLQSTDSLTVCGGYLRLYNIYKGMGQMDSAYHYHNLFRQYDSDITLRRQTAEVAAIPHKMKVAQLAKENRTLTGWRLWQAVSLVVVVLVAFVVYAVIRKRHSREQQVKDCKLQAVDNKLGKTSAELGRLKGAMANHVEAVERLKEEHRKILDRHKDEIERLKKSVEELEADIRQMKATDRTAKKNEKDLKRALQTMENELGRNVAKLTEAEHQRAIDQRIEYFLSSGYDSIAVDLLLQLRLDKRGTFRYDIKPSEYLPLLKVLLEQESPALHERLENSGLEWKKLTMCYLMALGLDDVEMMSNAACLAVSSVKRYRKECREVVESLSRSALRRGQ